MQLDGGGPWGSRLHGLRGRSRGYAVGAADAAAAGRRGWGSGRSARPAGAARTNEAEEDWEEDDGVEDAEHEDEDHGLVEGDEHIRVAERHDQRRQQRRRGTVEYRQRDLHHTYQPSTGKAGRLHTYTRSI